MAEKSEVLIVGYKIKFEEENPFGMKLDIKQHVKSHVITVAFCFPAAVQLLGRDSTESGDLAVFARTGFLKKKFLWS